MKLKRFGSISQLLQLFRGKLLPFGVSIVLLVGNLLFYTNLYSCYRENLLTSLNLYGVVRVVNQFVSVLKHSSVNISLPGLGGEVAIGEVLDPLGDATERLSDLFTIGIWSWGGEMIFTEKYGILF
ncbi:MAG: hypothetical protein ABGW77_01730 [Campylobacterales bacterium]